MLSPFRSRPRRVAFEELLARYPDFELEEEPGWVTSRWARSHPALRLRLRASGS